MSDEQPASQDNSLVINQLIAEYMGRTDSGETLSPDEFIAAHPDHAEELRQHFENIELLDGLQQTDGQQDLDTQPDAGNGGKPKQVDPDQTVTRGGTDSETSVTRDFERRDTEKTEVAIPEQFGRYAIKKVLGQGAMGAVYLARDTQLDRDVALKIPKFGDGNGVDDEELLARFYREARASATIRSLNICPVHDVGEIDGQHYITMAFIEGRPLKDFTKSKKKHSEKQIATTIRKLALGLAEAHSIGVIHRDLKPANIMVDLKGEPVVMDFGLARRSSSDDVQVTQSGAILGTPAYMAPEQVAGDQAAINHQVDIYALGVIMYELITGEMPFKGNLMAILQQIALNNPTKPSELRDNLDPRLEKICLKLMAGDQKKRYQSMNDVAADLQDVLRNPGKRQKRDQAKQTGPKPTSIPTANEESNPALISIEQPKSFAEQLREKKSKPTKKSTRSSGQSGSKSKRGQKAASNGPPKNILIAGGVGGLLLLLGIIFFVRVGKYDVQITLDDPSITLSVDGDVLNINDGDDVIKLSAGEHKLQLQKDGLKTHVEEFTVTKDGKTALTAKVVNGQLDALLNGEEVLDSSAVTPSMTNKEDFPKAPSSANSKLANGLAFSTPDAQVITEPIPINLSEPFTIELWCRPEKIREIESRLGTVQIAFRMENLELKLERYHHLPEPHWACVVAGKSNSGTAGFGQHVPLVVEPGELVHIACQWTGQELQLFQNGSSKNIKYTRWGDSDLDDAEFLKQFVQSSPEVEMKIGSRLLSFNGRPTHFDGVIHQVRVSRTARYRSDFVPKSPLVPDEHTVALYGFESGQGDVLKDSSGNGHHGKIVGAKWVPANVDSVSGPDAVNTRSATVLKLSPGEGVTFESLVDETDSLTMEFWLQLDQSMAHVYLLGPSRDYCLRTGSTGQIALKGVKSTVPNRYELGDPARFPTARFVHVAMVRDAETQQHRLYVDGTLSESVDKIVSPLRDYFQIGGTERQYNFQSGLGFDGLIDEVRISSSARYSGESFSPQLRFDPDENTLALYHCDEIKDGLLLDSSGNNHHGKVFGATIQSIKFDVPTGVKIGPASSVSSSEIPPPAVAPFDTKQAKAHQEAWADYLGVPVEYENSIGMKFRLIPPGEFLMGSTPEEIEAALKVAGENETWRERINSEGPQHKVIFTQPVYLGVTEVTQSQYEQVMGTNPSHFSATGAGKDSVANLETSNHPVEKVSWNDAVEFCAKLSQQEKLKPFYFRSGETVTPLDGTGYRLPTEAEWEHACRAGTTTRFCSGDGEQDLVSAGWFNGNSGNRTHAAGELKANPFGLWDVHGNVWEWVQDSWDPAFYGKFEENAAINPSGPFSAGSRRVSRGGGWYGNPIHCRSSDRSPILLTGRYIYLGFRVVLPVDAVKESLQPKDASSTGKVTKGWPADAPSAAIAPFNTEQAQVHQEAWADYLGVPVQYTNSIGMKFRLIPPGEFLMGSTPEEIEASLKTVAPHRKQFIESEAPRHKVILSQPVYVSVTEVTQAQYEQIMGTNPSHFAVTGEGQDAVISLETDNHPVEMVSWNDAAEFCAKLSQQEKLKPFYLRSNETVTPLDGTGYRLPTEAEWEHACRAGTTTRFCSGDGEQDLVSAGWFNGNSGNRTHAAGELKANPFGLWDVHGNVWEWVQDSWDPSIYEKFQEAPAVNPNNPFSKNSQRMFRGGSWNHPLADCRSSIRFAAVNSTLAFNNRGFRVVLTVDAVKEGSQQKDASSTGKVTKGWSDDAPSAAIAPFDTEQAEAHQETWAKQLGEPVETTNSIGMQLAVIPPGSFKMGESGETVDVTLTKPFRLGIHVVTQGQWQAVMATEPWKGQGNVIEGDKIPATYVSWTDATEFCHQLTERERAAGKLRDGWEYRLPTEAEWEWACRAGTTTRYSFGDDESLLEEHAWFNSNTKNAGEAYAHQVGLKKPNPWGLYDIHGNVWEWCSDWSGDALPGGTDPSGPTEGSHRVHRGGSCDNSVRGCRSALRLGGSPSGRHDRLGFRVTLSPVVQAAPPPAVAPFDAEQAMAHQEAWAKYLGEPVVTTNSIGMKLAVIPPGTFTMGEGKGAVMVALTKPFRCGVHEVTQGQWKAVMASEPWSKGADVQKGENFPAMAVKWTEATEFCHKLTEHERVAGKITDDWEYRLPTDAEWEFACRAGTMAKYSFGGDGALMDQYAWYDSNTISANELYAHSVGLKLPNPWGLHDMHGNVSEWCLDWYKENIEEGGVDPQGPSEGTLRVLRGGSWKYPAGDSRSANRWRYDPSSRNFLNSFRGVLSPIGKE